MNDLIKIAANDISELRSSDVYRVLEQNSFSIISDLADFIISRRPDLKDEVQDCVIEISEV